MFTLAYVHICYHDNKYNRMLRVSYTSARMRMPTIPIAVVTDPDTARFLRDSNDPILRDPYARIVEVECPAKYIPLEKALFLKSCIREHISGDYLYLDTDTVICEDFSQYDFDCSVGMVADTHMYTHEQPDLLQAETAMARFRRLDMREWDLIHNGGVMFVRDDAPARQLCREWHDLWMRTETPEFERDQFSLHQVNNRLQIIKELDGTWNCMVSFLPVSLRYLANAKIIHYFSVEFYCPYLLRDPKYLFLDMDDPAMRQILREPKTAFAKRALDSFLLGLDGSFFARRWGRWKLYRLTMKLVRRAIRRKTREFLRRRQKSSNK